MVLLSHAGRARRHVHSVDDATMLFRVVAVFVMLPLAARLEWSRLVRVLDRASDLLSVGPGPRADRMDFYIRACGAVHWGPFQDDCVSLSLARFALLNHPHRLLDVLVGVRVEGRSEAGPRLDRRHVWLTTPDGKPYLETAPVDGYTVQCRHRQTRRPRSTDGFARFVALLGASGLGSVSAAVAAVARTKMIAVGLGPVGLGLVNQMAAAVNATAWISAFGASGTARLIAESLGRQRPDEAGAAVRTMIVVLSSAAVLAVLAGVLMRAWLADLVFGNPAATSWALWLLMALPCAAVASAAGAVLRGTQSVGRLALSRLVTSVVSVIGCWLIVRTGQSGNVVLVPLVLVGSLAVSSSALAWPICRPWISAGGQWLQIRAARAVASYGLANVLMGVATASALLAIGRQYLAAGDFDTAGRIAALAWLGEPLVGALVAGHQASTYPAYAAAVGPSAASVLTRGVRGLVILAVPVLALAGLVAAPLVTFAFSSAFRDITPLVATMALATYTRSVNVVVGLPLLARGHLVAMSVAHLGWAAGLAVMATIWSGPGTIGAAGFVAACLFASVGHLFVLLLLLGRYGLAPARHDLVWLAAGAAPLALLAVGG